ncbi:unnamed protein product [Schistosoma rodhaini]|uniref:Uncharacterized protein n=1 Tax=Schistosoma rodhaini TaxID=6188 RepID=A0AA85FUU8_9TREM|nr:unnamed protein product [Schistosoma rodhaini]
MASNYPEMHLMTTRKVTSGEAFSKVLIPGSSTKYVITTDAKKSTTDIIGTTILTAVGVSSIYLSNSAKSEVVKFEVIQNCRQLSVILPFSTNSQVLDFFRKRLGITNIKIQSNILVLRTGSQ